MANATALYANFSHALQRRHTSYISFGDLEACHRSLEAMDHDSDACTFVMKTGSCNDIVNLFDYLKFMLCTLKIKSSTMGAVEMCLLMLFVVGCYIVFLYIISRYFILPNVIHVAHYMHVPLYDYGVTAIAVILAAPDVLWVVQTCHKFSQNGTLLLAHMVGKSFATYTVGLGVICLRGQTKVPGFEFVLQTFIAIFVFIYTLVVLHYKLEWDQIIDSDQMEVDVRAHAFILTVVYVAYITYLIFTKRRASRLTSIKQKLTHHLVVYEPTNGWTQLWNSLNAFNHMHFKKWWVTVLFPFWILAALQIPVIDKQRPMFGWCKYLTFLNLIIFPWQSYYVKNTHSKTILIIISFLVAIVAVITMLCTSVHEPPKYQGFYAVSGIIFGLSTYHIVGGELETILWQTFSYNFNMSRDIIMLTGFVFNYLLNAVIFGYELVVMGYGNLACGVVVGIVLNQAFLVLPIVVFQYCYDIQSLVAISANTLTCFIFMLIVFFSTIFALSSTNFQLRLSHGIYLFLIYCVFLIFLIFTYTGTIHPYGGFHSVAVEIKTEETKWA